MRAESEERGQGQGSALPKVLRRLWGRPPAARRPAPGSGPLDLSPSTAFEALLQERLKGVESGLSELKSRVNGLLFLVTGAVIVQLVLGLVR